MQEASIPPMSDVSSLSVGMLALLFTDIEGSTDHWERSPQAMRRALARHDALMHDAIGRAGGNVFKTVGDAFCATFTDVSAAIAAALLAQRAMKVDGFAEIDGLKVRMAVHAGKVEAREGDYFGQSLNRVARLLAIGHGNQVLVSRVAADLVRGDLPPRVSLRELGPHRLKDLVLPEEVFQLVSPDLPSDFPPLRSLAALPNNLPQQVTTFIGREHELAKIKALLEENRLVTLVGSGGVGKTRVSLQVGADVMDHYVDGVWLVELASIIDPMLVAETIAGIFGVPAAIGRSPLDVIVDLLRRKRALLILDNCEHLIAAVAKLADALIRGCPDLSVLASSREPLRIAGESTYRLPPLHYPNQLDGISAEAALGFAAVRLFAERASTMIPGFAVTDANAPAVSSICKRLDGVPLAIELAVPRLKIMTPQELEAHLNDRFKILTAGSRTVLPRQQTLKALIGWSYDLLDEAERTLLRRLSVFAEAWTLDSAAFVAGGNPVQEWEILDLLASLVDKSLVVAHATGSQTRYSMSESTRNFAHEKLLESGERGRRQKLAAFLLALYAQAETIWPVTPTNVWLEAYAPELDNLRAALEWAFGPDGNAALGVELVSHSLHILLELCLFREIFRWFDTAIERLDSTTSTAASARIWIGKSQANLFFNEPETVKPALRAVALYRQIGPTQELGVALTRAAAAVSTPSDYVEANRLLSEAHAILRPLGRTKHLASCLMVMASIRNDAAVAARDLHGGGAKGLGSRNDAAVVRELYAEAEAICRAIGDNSGLRFILALVAEAEMANGDAQAAANLARELVADALRNNDRRAVAHVRVNLAGYLLALGSIQEARDLAIECLRDSRALGLSFVTGCVEHLALVAVVGGQVERAARLLGYGSAWYAARGMPRENTEQVTYDRLRVLLNEALPQDQCDQLMAEGAAWNEDHAADEALKV